jgi:spermidine synthase
MERLLSRRCACGQSVAGLYGVNTLGAVFGVLLTTFWLAPTFGYSASILVLAAINLLCAVATLLGPAVGERQRSEIDQSFERAPAPGRLAHLLFWTGLLGIGYEVLCVRVLAERLEGTVYSFASVLQVFLLGTAVGAMAYQKFLLGLTGPSRRVRRSFLSTLTWLLVLLCFSCMAGTWMLARSAALYDFFLQSFGVGLINSVLAEACVAWAVLGLPTLCMGATASHLLQASRQKEQGVGRGMGWNTLGGSLASVVVGVVLVYLLGPKWSLVLVSLGYLALLPWRELRLAHAVPIVGILVLLNSLPVNLVHLDVPAHARVLTYRAGVRAGVAVLEHGKGQRTLKVNNRYSMGGTLQSFADRRQAHLPLLLHESPGQALFLGVGTGITAGAATLHPGLEVWAVELLPELVDLLPYFEPANQSQVLRERHHLVTADARRFVRATKERFDVIVGDLFHPARDGAASLYTVEHFQAIRDCLEPEGLFCQWLPLFQLDLRTTAIIVQTFLQVFPQATAFLAYYNVETPIVGLMGSLHRRTYPPGWRSQRVQRTELSNALWDVALTTDSSILGCYWTDAAALARFADGHPINSDEHPHVLFQAPEFSYLDRSDGVENMEALLELWPSSADSVVRAGDHGLAASFPARLDAYFVARNEYLRAMILQARGKFAESLPVFQSSIAASRDFTTTIEVLLGQAESLHKESPDRAKQIYAALIEVKPSDLRAKRYLGRLLDDLKDPAQEEEGSHSQEHSHGHEH